MKLAVLTALVASAAAFAPAKQAASSTSALAAFKDELGAQAPLGYFDPLGVMEGKDGAEFARLRALELKHGRIASKCNATPVMCRRNNLWTVF